MVLRLAPAATNDQYCGCISDLRHFAISRNDHEQLLVFANLDKGNFARLDAGEPLLYVKPVRDGSNQRLRCR